MNKRFLSHYFLLAFILVCSHAHGTDSSEIQRLHKNIEEQLIDIRKEYPAAQQKIYSMLDQVSRLTSIASAAHSKIQTLERELKTKESEFNILQDELVKSKKQALDTEDQQKNVTNSFEKEKKLAQELEQAKKKTDLQAQAQAQHYKNFVQEVQPEASDSQASQGQQDQMDEQKTPRNTIKAKHSNLSEPKRQ